MESIQVQNMPKTNFIWLGFFPLYIKIKTKTNRTTHWFYTVPIDYTYKWSVLLSTPLRKEGISFSRNHLEMVQEVEETLSNGVDCTSRLAASPCRSAKLSCCCCCPRGVGGAAGFDGVRVMVTCERACVHMLLGSAVTPSLHGETLPLSRQR